MTLASLVQRVRDAVSLKSLQRKLPVIYRCWPLLIVLALATIEMAHVATSTWKHYFLYDGDSLTLALLRQSVMHGEPFQWVFSSQVFLFPEALFYFICGALTTSVRASLMLSGYLNLVLLYGLFWFVAWALPVRTSLRRHGYALACSTLFVIYMLLERTPLINQSALASLFLFTTYYYGVILSGLFVAALYLLLINPKRRLQPASRYKLYGLIVGIGALTQLSDPLFALQFGLPCMLTIFVMYIVAQFSFKEAAQLISLQLAIIVLGQLLRLPLKEHIAAGIQGYLHPANVSGSITMLKTVSKQVVGSPPSLLEYLIIATVILVSLVLALSYIRTICARSARRPPRQYLWLTIFASLVPAVLLAITVFTGTTTTRYMVPLTIFPMLGLLPLANTTLPRKFQPWLRPVAAAGVAVILVFGVLSIPKAARILNRSDGPDVACLSHALNNQPAYGVASYWRARSLEAYGLPNEHVLDTTDNLKPFIWLNNRASYVGHDFSFVISDAPASPQSAQQHTINSLGQADTLVHCAGFDVTIFKPGNPARHSLNTKITNPTN